MTPLSPHVSPIEKVGAWCDAPQSRLAGLRKKERQISLLWAIFCIVATSLSNAIGASAAADPILQSPGLVGFWDFKEAPGQPRLSKGTKQQHPLQEVGGPIARVEGGAFSGFSAELNGRQYFKIPYTETGDLNISGPDAQVSMFAAVRIVNLNQSRTIAGMWSEGKGANDDTGTRQYALLMNMPTYGGPRQLTPHISSEGGVTRRADGSAFPWCADYAASDQKCRKSSGAHWRSLTMENTFARILMACSIRDRSIRKRTNAATVISPVKGPAAKIVA